MTKDPNQFGLDEETVDLDQSKAAKESGLSDNSLLDLTGSLHPRQKVSLIRHLITQLPSYELEPLKKFIKDEENERDQIEQQGGMPSKLKIPVHRIKVKKDYSFRKFGLTCPQQYYISISAKYKVHGDIYMGVLFFVEAGYVLDYVSSRLGALQFNPETSVFRLESSRSSQYKIVRLVMLTPPPPDYDVMKIRPEIYNRIPSFLHVEILDDNLQIVEREQHQFPACMFRSGVFDRDYWDQVTVVKAATLAASTSKLAQKDSQVSGFSQSVPPKIRDIRQPKMQPNSTFMIVNQAKTSLMTSYLRQLAVLSQKALPDSPWQLNLSNLNYKLLHSSQRTIVEIRVNTQEVLPGNMPLNVLSEWCRDLGVQISQNASSTRYSERDKEIGRNLMIEFSAEVTDPLTFLEKFFRSIKGVQLKRRANS